MNDKWNELVALTEPPCERRRSSGVSSISGGGKCGCQSSSVSGTGWILRQGLSGWRWHKWKKDNLEFPISQTFREDPDKGFKAPRDERKSKLTCEPRCQPGLPCVWSEDAWVHACSHSIRAVLVDSFLWAFQWSDGEMMPSGERKKANMADAKNIVNKCVLWSTGEIRSGSYMESDKFLTEEPYFDAVIERNNHLFLDAALPRHFLEHLLQVAYIHTQLTSALP